MTPIPFPESNSKLTAPKSMPACVNLHTFRDGTQCISCWQPDETERAAIAAGAPIWLFVMTPKTHPPIGLSTVSPFLPPVAHDKG